VRDLLLSVLEFLFPPACARCRGVVGDGALCDACARALPRLPHGSCPRCLAAPAAGGGGPCSACSSRRSRLAGLVAEAPYEGEIERFVHRFKYPRAGLLGLDPAPEALLGSLLLDAAARIVGPAPDLIVPVPQHPAGLRRRGFNPAAVLAGALALAKQTRHSPRALLRLRDGPSQTGLDRRARRGNVAHVFRARLPMPARVWLVDDVVTTGATLEEAARMLRLAGAREVVAVCVARTLLRDGSALSVRLPARGSSPHPRCRGSPGVGASDRRAS